MNLDSRLVAELEALSLRTPQDYFRGVRAPEVCRVDNIMMFLRRERAVLHDSVITARPHHRFVLMVNYATAGTVNVDGVAYRVHPGEAFLIAPYQLHFYMDVAGKSIRWLFMTFEAPDRSLFEPVLNMPIPLGGAEQADVLRVARDYRGVELAGAGAREALILQASMLVARVRQLGVACTPPLLALPPDYELVGRLNRLLEWHLAGGLGIVALAERLGMSESHLRKRFREITRLSLGGYLRRYRLNRAIKLLRHSNQSMTQIAVECGYESLAAFSRSFKAELGTPPTEFRRKSGLSL